MVILFNFGAVCITNVLVVKDQPEVMHSLAEANPIHAKANNLKVHPQYVEVMSALARQAVLWFILIFIYLYYRKIIYSDIQLVLFGTIVLYYFVLTGWDFFNDFGYLLGGWIFG